MAELIIDERKKTYLNQEGADSAYSGQFEKNMTVCVESLIGEKSSESVKLETQVVITDQGIERLDSFPFEET